MATKRVVKKSKISTPIKKEVSNSKTLGWIFIVIGLFIIVRDSVGFVFSHAWPVLLILIGAYLLWYRDKR